MCSRNAAGYLEAKKPFVRIKEAWEPAYQLRRCRMPVRFLTAGTGFLQ